ncbi:UNVERIFIED_CONTAM: hypothetical protein GTU68_058810 [Idotea baltica]|nr:hypothetical protein [Idotea baltica]
MSFSHLNNCNSISSFQVQCFLSLFFTLLSIVIRVKGLKYLSGDFLTDSTAKAPDGNTYPKDEVEHLITKELPKTRRGRSMQFIDDPWNTRKTLLEWQSQSRFGHGRSFEGREISAPSSTNSVFPTDIDATVRTRSPAHNSSSPTTPLPPKAASSCETANAPQRLCKTKYNTTAPMYGVSLTSGKPVTIVQKFPDLLQQVIFEVCASETCDVVHGDCVQTYMPYLFLVIPLGPVTLTGQDYVLVESGCVCRPKYAGAKPATNPLDAIGFGNDLE